MSPDFQPCSSTSCPGGGPLFSSQPNCLLPRPGSHERLQEGDPGPAGRLPVLRAYGLSLLLVLILLLAYCAFFTPHFETSDDVQMAMITSGCGICDRPDEHLVYSHVLIGFALKWLYQLSPGFPWYGAYLIAAQAIGLAGILAVFLLKRSAYVGALLFLLFFMIAGSSCLANLQFTSTALILAQAGMLTMIFSLDQEQSAAGKMRPIFLGLSGLFLLVAMLMRPESGELGILLSGSLLVIRYFRLPKPDSRLLPGLGLLAVVLAVGGLLWLINHTYYHADGRWRNFYTWNDCKAKITDYERVKDRSAVLSQVGWTANDLAMMKEFLFLDQERFALPKLQNILAGARPYRSGLKLGYVLQEIWDAASNRFTCGALLAVPALIWFLDRRRFGPLKAVAFLMCILAVALYLICCLRLAQRVSLPLAAFTAGLFLYYLDLPYLGAVLGKAFGLTLWRRCLAILVACAALAAVIGNWYHLHRGASQAALTQNRILKRAIRELKPSKEQLFLIGAPPSPVKFILPYENPDVCFSSTRLLWTPFNFPFGHDRIRQSGAANFQQLLKRKNVLLLDGKSGYSAWLVKTFMKEHFNQSVQLVLVYRCLPLRLEVYRVDPPQSDPGAGS